MNKIYIPEGYSPKLNRYDTQRAIDIIKQLFQQNFCKALSLKRVSAPLFVSCSSGLNDNLNGTERPVTFDVPAIEGDAEIVHSLAKWKRLALKRYDFWMHEGLLTDMNAIRRDEELDNIHSIYVDQWDWEKVIEDSDRNPQYLRETVQKIVDTICDVNELLQEKFPQLDTKIERNVKFITSQELEDLYPDLTPEERECEFAREHKTIFIMGIGGKLKSGNKHGNRAPDYDDWSLNGDIIFWDNVRNAPIEISSMGIRVNKEVLDRQLSLAGCDDRRELSFHKMLLNDELPLTIGGGIGQSRLCMLLMGCAHVGEVQCSLWDEETVRLCKENHIRLL